MLPLGKGQETLSGLSPLSDRRQSLAATEGWKRRPRKANSEGAGSQALPKSEGRAKEL